jgi:hypothetical protein
VDEQADSDVRRAFAAVGGTMTGYLSFPPSGPAGGPAFGQWTSKPGDPPSPFPLLAAALPGSEWAVPGPAGPVAEMKGPAAAANVAAHKSGSHEGGPHESGLAAMFRALHGVPAPAAAGQNDIAGLGDLFRRL